MGEEEYCDGGRRLERREPGASQVRPTGYWFFLKAQPGAFHLVALPGELPTRIAVQRVQQDPPCRQSMTPWRHVSFRPSSVSSHQP